MTDPTTPPIVCDMTGAPDTTVERLDEYAQLFADALIDRERTPEGANRFRFRANDGIEERVRTLAAKEKACCGFFDFTVTVHGDEIWWDATTVDDPMARQVLDEMYRLPDTVGEGVAALFERFDQQGLRVVTNDDGIMRPPPRPMSSASPAREERQQVSQQGSPRQASRPSRAARAAMNSAATGSAHHQPRVALATRPTRSTTDR